MPVLITKSPFKLEFLPSYMTKGIASGWTAWAGPIPYTVFRCDATAGPLRSFYAAYLGTERSLQLRALDNSGLFDTPEGAMAACQTHLDSIVEFVLSLPKDSPA